MLGSARFRLEQLARTREGFPGGLGRMAVRRDASLSECKLQFELRAPTVDSIALGLDQADGVVQVGNGLVVGRFDSAASPAWRQ